MTAEAIRLQFSPDGDMRRMNIKDAIEVLHRLFLRNSDENSPDFQVLTDVQSHALYEILTQRCGVRSIPRGRDAKAFWADDGGEQA